MIAFNRCLSRSQSPLQQQRHPPSAAVSEADGSASSSASSSGKGSTQSSEDGSGSKPGSAATAKVDSSKVVETFDVDASQTLAEHAASHNFPIHVRECGPCRFWKHRVQREKNFRKGLRHQLGCCASAERAIRGVIGDTELEATADTSKLTRSC